VSEEKGRSLTDDGQYLDGADNVDRLLEANTFRKRLEEETAGDLAKPYNCSPDQ
jgi:hypothetical protein